MSEIEPIRVGLVAHHTFCPRRAWLEVHGERTDTAQVAQGVVDHAAVDDPATSRSELLRAVDVRSTRLGLVGRCDTIELTDEGMIVVEHKAAPIRRKAETTLPQRVQLALQALCLREEGHDVVGAAVWFSTVKRRVEVRLDAALIEEAERQASATHAMVVDRPPSPLEDDPRCGGCSHVEVCLPDEHRAQTSARRIGVGDPTGRVLHLATAGSRASLRRGQILVRSREGEITVPLGQTAGLVVHGNADVSSALLREILERGYPIVWCAWSGRVVGWACPANGPNGDARRRQHRLTSDIQLSVARSIIVAKVGNQAALLRRHDGTSAAALRRLSADAARASNHGELLGIEGRAAALYFGELDLGLKPEWATMARRVSRPAPDRVNVALNLVYGLLLADVLRSIVACGLDPSGGVLHSSGRNKPALALDLMEELRSPVADSAVLWAINNGELKAQDFREDLDAVRLKQGGRKALISAYERRAMSEFVHPVFGYRVTWRRAMEIQARMFLAVVLGELDRYQPIRSR